MRLLTTTAALIALPLLVSASPALTSRDDTTAIIGTFSDAHCTQNQRDDSAGMPFPQHYGPCKELPGQSMKIWWLKKFCPGMCSSIL